MRMWEEKTKEEAGEKKVIQASAGSLNMFSLNGLSFKRELHES